MKKNTIIALIIALVVIIGIILIATSGSTSQTPSGGNPAAESTNTAQPTVQVVPATSSSGASGNTSSPSASAMTPTTELFANSEYASSAYLIYPGPLSAAASRAINGFDLQTSDLGHGLTKVTLVAKQQNYVTQTFTLAAGQKLYFVERSFGDDQNDADSFTGDDHAYAVDANGYILQ